MAFIHENLSITVQTIGGVGMRFAFYRTDDDVSTVTSDGYFERGAAHGLRLNDLIFVSPITAGFEPYALNVTAVDGDGDVTASLSDEDMRKSVYDPGGKAEQVLTVGDVGEPGGLQAYHENLDTLSEATLTTAGMALLSASDAAAQRAALGLDVADRAVMKALPSTITSAYLKEPGREGQFIWREGDYSAQVAADTAEGIYIQSDNVAASEGAWVRVFDGPVNVAWFGADMSGSTPSQDAFSAVVKIAKAENNYISWYEDMPNAPTTTIEIPGGRYLLTDYVDTGGKTVNWVVADDAVFVNDCAKFLTGRIVRSSRIGLDEPYGTLDNACGFAVRVGNGFFGMPQIGADSPAGVSGWIDPDDMCVFFDEGSVGLQADAAASENVIFRGDNTYHADGVTLSDPVDVRRLRVGMVVQTTHSPPFRGVLVNWEPDGDRLYVLRWLELGDMTRTPQTPGGDDALFVNPMAKVWGANINSFLTENGYSFQAASAEFGVWNDKETPANFRDGLGRTWGADVVNLGPRKGSSGFISRGAFFNGFTAAGSDIGFNAAGFPELAATAPPIGFAYDGDGVGFRQRNNDGVPFLISLNGVLDFGAQGGANTPVLNFHSGAVNVQFDSRIYASGGTGATGGGALTLEAAAVETTALRPVADNTYVLGASDRRWNVVFAATGSINTSDERLKKFLDAHLLEPVKRAVRRLEITPYQFLDAIAAKGEENARIHIGVSAQEVEAAFAAEGVDAHRWALFCEDPEYEDVEVSEEVEEIEMETFEEVVDRPVVQGDRVVVEKVTVQGTRPKTVTLPVFNEDGSPGMRDVAVTRGGVPVMIGKGDKKRTLRTKEPATMEIPVKKIITKTRIESRPTGKTRLGLRYDQLLLLMIAAMGDVNA